MGMRKTVLLLTAIAATLLLASGTALAVTKFGDAGNDVLYGTNQTDSLYGGEGDDVLYGRGDDDRDFGGNGGGLYGGSGDDTIYGGAGNDELWSAPSYGGAPILAEDKNVLYGDKGNDDLRGGEGTDLLYGGEGNDLLEGAFDIRAIRPDTFYGGGGNDYIISTQVPGDVRDFVYCGPGTDRVLAEPEDVVAKDCERVRRFS